MITDPNLVILYVESPSKSGAFYADLLGMEPIQSSPTFVMFQLKQGFRLGLWSISAMKPETTVLGGGTELALQVENDADVDDLYRQWQQLNINMLQEPTTMGFGYSFMALDPDQHRLRVFALNQDLASK